MKKPIENNLNIKKIADNATNIHNKLNNKVNNNSKNINNNKKNDIIQKNYNINIKNSNNIIKNSNNIIKSSNSNNNKSANRPANISSNKPTINTYDPFNPHKKPVISNKQYNPLEPVNQNKQINLKRNHREIYSEEEDENLDGFIDDDDSEPVNMDYRSEIRKIMRYDPKKYNDDDYDDDAMEVGFNEIEKEENVASLIARKEDEIEWKYIQRDKMKEEMRKKKK